MENDFLNHGHVYPSIRRDVREKENNRSSDGAKPNSNPANQQEPSEIITKKKKKAFALEILLLLFSSLLRHEEITK